VKQYNQELCISSNYLKTTNELFFEFYQMCCSIVRRFYIILNFFMISVIFIEVNLKMVRFNESYWNYKKNILKKCCHTVKMVDTLTVLKYNYDHINNLFIKIIYIKTQIWQVGLHQNNNINVKILCELICVRSMYYTSIRKILQHIKLKILVGSNIINKITF